MSKHRLEVELILNIEAIKECKSDIELIQLLNQRSNLKDMLIEALKCELDRVS
jgi:hypothetical protein